MENAQNVLPIREIPNYIDAEIWQDFIQWRKESRHKLTPTSTKYLLRKLARFHAAKIDVNACLVQTMECGWQGVFEIKQKAETKRQYLPVEDEDLWPWAKMEGYPDPMKDEKFKAYRQRLGHLMRDKQDKVERIY